MAHRDFPADAPLPHGNAWSRPTDPARIRPERRKPELVNVLGTGPTRTTADLTDAERRRFDAQLELFRAAHRLAVAYHLSATYGIPVPSAEVRAWTDARRRWNGHRSTRPFAERN